MSKWFYLPISFYRSKWLKFKARLSVHQACLIHLARCRLLNCAAWGVISVRRQLDANVSVMGWTAPSLGQSRGLRVWVCGERAKRRGDKTDLVMLLVRQGALPSGYADAQAPTLPANFDLELEGGWDNTGWLAGDELSNRTTCRRGTNKRVFRQRQHEPLRPSNKLSCWLLTLLSGIKSVCLSWLSP